MSNQLHREMQASGIPSMGADDRIPLNTPFKTHTGQWVILTDGTAKWYGTSKPTPAPDRALLDKVAQVRANHVPEAPKLPLPDLRLVLVAQEKRYRGLLLSNEEQTALDILISQAVE